MTSTQPYTPDISDRVSIMVEDLGAAVARNWGWVLLRGLLGVAIGIIALVHPMATLGALVLLFAVYSIVDGITAIIASVRAMRRDQSWGWLLLQGILSLGAAAVALFMPLLAIKVFLFVMAFWAIIGGLALAVAGFKLPGDHGRWWLVIGGALSMLWGVLLLFQPVLGALVLTIWFGVYTLVFGIFFTIIAITLRNRHKQRLAAA